MHIGVLGGSLGTYRDYWDPRGLIGDSHGILGLSGGSSGSYSAYWGLRAQGSVTGHKGVFPGGGGQWGLTGLSSQRGPLGSHRICRDSFC